jgi:hypothetical protein
MKQLHMHKLQSQAKFRKLPSVLLKIQSQAKFRKQAKQALHRMKQLHMHKRRTELVEAAPIAVADRKISR